MEKCKICGGNCDNGELTGGVCPECIEKEKETEMRTGKIARIMNSPCCQMELGLEV